MGDTVYIDTQGIENSVYNGIVQSMPDLEPLVRAAYVFELQEVEKRLEALELDFFFWLGVVRAIEAALS